MAVQLVVDRLEAGHVDVADVLVQSFQIVLEQAGVQFDLHLTGGTQAALVGQSHFLGHAG
jgi:hypothetical protein